MSSREETRAREMEQQIAYLRWKRMQNDREIKKAIGVSKALKQRDAVLCHSVDKPGDKFVWTHSVVQDELQRPLVITDEELYYLQSEEVKSKRRLEKYAQRHIQTISKAVESLQEKTFHSEVAQKVNSEKLEMLRGLKRDVKSHLRTIQDSAPIIDTKISPVPKLF